MNESNIYFATNTYNYGGIYTGEAKNRFNEAKGDNDFFRQVMDYDALMKLKSSSQMHGTMNSNYYVAHIKQIRVLDPDFSSAMIRGRDVDPEIETENARLDAEYGYPEDNNYYPLLDEVMVDNKQLSYSDELMGKWEKADRGLNESVDNLLGLYIKQKVKQELGSKTISPKEAGLEDIDDIDPFYYIYEETAGKVRKSFGDIDKAKLYEEKYGSIFRIFEDVTQETIIKAPVNQYSFVNAGPGTGKTYTLIEKIKYMLNPPEGEIEPIEPEEILVLCFTNAAVNEIKARIKKFSEEEGDRSFINVDVRTFHSFSWLLISQANELFRDRSNYKYIDISSLSYDQSIKAARDIICKFGDEVFGGCKHLIVDEIQDLTNERASLVLSMVQECKKNNVGVTLLGDSCQAIYDYDDEERFFELKSDRFYKYLFSEFYSVGKFYKLEHNHRQNVKLSALSMPLRQAILSGEKNRVKNKIEDMKALIPNIQGISSGSISTKMSHNDFVKNTQNGTLCLMCRNNAQVLATSTNLRKRRIDHVVNAYNEFEYLSDWIGRIFSLYTKEIITFEEFCFLINRYNVTIEASSVWERLQDLIGSKNNVLQVVDILKAVGKSKVDDPIFRNIPHGNLIVSNIHKSKGREYDYVILEQKFINRLINDSSSIKSTPEYIEEAKTLYVAATRPRFKLFCNSLASTDVSLKKINTGRKRWVRGDGSNLKRIEVRAFSDADIDSLNNPDIQEYIIYNVNVGDEIKLLLNINSRTISYDIVHVTESGERIIGITTSEFVDDIDAIITPYKSPWPRQITDIYVSGIYSKISNDFQSVWCWVDFCGLGTAHNDVY